MVIFTPNHFTHLTLLLCLNLCDGLQVLFGLQSAGRVFWLYFFTFQIRDTTTTGLKFIGFVFNEEFCALDHLMYISNRKHCSMLGEGFVPQALIELWIRRSHAGKTVLVHRAVPALINANQ
jgi:hypothetical protein